MNRRTARRLEGLEDNFTELTQKVADLEERIESLQGTVNQLSGRVSDVEESDLPSNLRDDEKR